MATLKDFIKDPYTAMWEGYNPTLLSTGILMVTRLVDVKGLVTCIFASVWGTYYSGNICRILLTYLRNLCESLIALILVLCSYPLAPVYWIVLTLVLKKRYRSIVKRKQKLESLL